MGSKGLFFEQVASCTGGWPVWGVGHGRTGVHIPVENEHLFRFKMNADSGLRVHRFRTPQSTYSDVR